MGYAGMIDMMRRRRLVTTALLAPLLLSAIAFVSADEGCKVFSGSDCVEQEGCTLCKLNLPVVKVDFCIEEDLAEKLPDQLFHCGEEPPEPPVPVLVQGAASSSTAAAAILSDECSDLDKSTCGANHNCAWCVSAAVPSACYTLEQAKRLPSAVFSCELPHTQF